MPGGSAKAGKQSLEWDVLFPLDCGWHNRGVSADAAHPSRNVRLWRVPAIMFLWYEEAATNTQTLTFSAGDHNFNKYCRVLPIRGFEHLQRPSLWMEGLQGPPPGYNQKSHILWHREVAHSPGVTVIVVPHALLPTFFTKCRICYLWCYWNRFPLDTKRPLNMSH